MARLTSKRRASRRIMNCSRDNFVYIHLEDKMVFPGMSNETTAPWQTKSRRKKSEKKVKSEDPVT